MCLLTAAWVFLEDSCNEGWYSLSTKLRDTGTLTSRFITAATGTNSATIRPAYECRVSFSFASRKNSPSSWWWVSTWVEILCIFHCMLTYTASMLHVMAIAFILFWTVKNNRNIYMTSWWRHDDVSTYLHELERGLQRLNRVQLQFNKAHSINKVYYRLCGVVGLVYLTFKLPDDWLKPGTWKSTLYNVYCTSFTLYIVYCILYIACILIQEIEIKMYKSSSLEKAEKPLKGRKAAIRHNSLPGFG